MFKTATKRNTSARNVKHKKTTSKKTHKPHHTPTPRQQKPSSSLRTITTKQHFSTLHLAPLPAIKMSKRKAETQGDELPIITDHDDQQEQQQQDKQGGIAELSQYVAETRNRHFKKTRWTNQKKSMINALNEGDKEDEKATFTIGDYAAHRLAQVKDEVEVTPDAGLDATSPYRNTPYAKQLETKLTQLKRTFKSMELNIQEHFEVCNKAVKRNFATEGKEYDKKLHRLVYDRPYGDTTTPCSIAAVMPSPVQMNYRNKNSFTIGPAVNKENGALEVGFLCGRFAEGHVSVGSPEGSLTAPIGVQYATRRIKEWLNRNEIAKKYSSWDKLDASGLYRVVTIRDCQITKQLLICLQISPIAFQPESNYLTKAHPDDAHYDNYSQIPLAETDKRKEIRLRAENDRKAKELEIVAGDAGYREFVQSFRDFCIQEFYGGAIWRQGYPIKAGVNIGKTFIPPNDAYDVEKDAKKTDDRDKIFKAPSNQDSLFADAKNYVSPSTAAPSAAGKSFTEKFGYSLASVIVQSHGGVSNVADDSECLQECLFGSHYIYASLADLYFRVSVGSFLQVNQHAATSLYNIARNWAMTPPHNFHLQRPAVEQLYLTKLREIADAFDMKLADAKVTTTAITPVEDLKMDPQELIVPPPELSANFTKPSVLFDVCCGTGTIGLINSQSANKVVGIDIAPSAIDDANANALLNGIPDAEFICGKAEAVIEGVLHENRDNVKTSVAILDPPREGLHTKVLRALRDSDLQRIVYISCNQKSLADDVLRLCGPTSKQYPKAPFVPIVATGADLFPHTEHCEVVMMLERRPEGQSAEEVKAERNRAKREEYEAREAAEKAAAEAQAATGTTAETTPTAEVVDEKKMEDRKEE